MRLDNNIEAVFSYLKSQKIHLSKHNLAFQVQSHSNFPSLLSFSDTLHFLGISNSVFSLEFEDFEKLPDSFLALLGEENGQVGLFHVTKQGSYYLYRKDKKKIKATKDELQTLWKNVVLLAEIPEEDVFNPEIKFPTEFIVASLLLIVVGAIYLFSHSLFFSIFGLLSSIGIFMSVEAVKTELGIESKISQGLCNIVANADCEQVINSVKNKWLQEIKISDIALWFFSSQLFALFLFSLTKYSDKFLSYCIISLFITIPMTLYSIYFQYKIEKKWCLVCLSIIGIIYLELIFLLSLNLTFKFETLSLMLFLIIFSIIGILVYLIKPVFTEKRDLSNSYIKLLRFSKDYLIFKNTLANSEKQNFEKEFFILGNRQSKNKISIITSLTCEFCKNAHSLLDNLYSQFGQNLAIILRFNYYDDLSIGTKELYLRLGEIYENKTELDFMSALQYWFENKNLEDWFNKFGKPENSIIIQEKLKEVTAENLEKGLNFTPIIFLNQYIFPNQYEIENLEYFIADWIEDKTI